MGSPNRIFVDERLEPGANFAIDGERARYVSRSLRLKKDDPLTVFDGRGGEYRAVVAAAAKGRVDINTLEFVDRDVESPLQLHLLQGVSRGDRMDTVVQKATELGIARITPVLTDYSVVRLDEQRAASRAQHWMRIAISACEQCGRNRVPIVDAPGPLGDRFGQADRLPDLRVMFHPDADESVQDLLPGAESVAALIGPEGGLSPSEVDHAVAAGFRPLSLGPRILRTETAAVAAITLLQSSLGDLR